jgi:UDP-N-acetylmuramoylalanine--D-glutamate ligase
MKEIKDRHIVVVGAARSGVAVASLLHRKGAVVFVTDNKEIPKNFKKRLHSEGIDFEESGHTARAGDGDFLVLSPGVPTRAPLVQKYLEEGKKVFSEMEVASWFNKSPMVAVTGSNGKTTVASWLAHTWKVADRPHVLAGNIGYAFSDSVEETAAGKEAILEVSSFQLDHIESFRPFISLLLNITPDHLDRYDNSLEKYAAAKFRITENQDSDDWFIYNFDDPMIQRHVESLKKKVAAPGCWDFQLPKSCKTGHLYATAKSSSESTTKKKCLCRLMN